MRLLVLGGTVFLGRHVVDAALARGHAVTIMNRGRERAETDPRVERLVADRRGDLAVLHGRSWDAAVDVAAYVPSVVERAAMLLAPSIDHYTFVSTRSVYADPSRSREDDAVATMSDREVVDAEAIAPEGRTRAQLYGKHYGALKARCEAAAERAMSGRVLVLRPGLLVGPFDSTDRFTYWPRRVARGGDVLAPGNPRRAVRFLDARDLADFVVSMIERRRTGVFNAAGADGFTMESFLDRTRAVVGGDARFRWANDAFLLARGVEPWSEMPLWIPSESNAFLETDNDKAIREGLRFRDLDATIADTLAWDRARGSPPLEAGMSEPREAAILRDLPS